jgi:deoxycytidylate deaminase
MKALARLASRANHKQHHIACVLTRGGSIISSGYNTNHLHAEHTALNRAWENGARGATALVVRFKSNGDLGMAKPCKLCTDRLIQAGVKKVLYSDTDGSIKSIRLPSKSVGKFYPLEYHFKGIHSRTVARRLPT